MGEKAYSKYAGLIVSVACSLFVIGILAILMQLIFLIEQDLPKISLQPTDADCSSADCRLSYAQLLVESDVLMARYTAAKSAMSSRLMIFVTAEIIALTLVVMGGVLIFDRIRSNNESLEISSAPKVGDGSVVGNVSAGSGAADAAPASTPKTPDARGWGVILGTSFPGILMCAFATIVLMYALHLSTTKGSRVQTNDTPIFQGSWGGGPQSDIGSDFQVFTFSPEETD